MVFRWMKRIGRLEILGGGPGEFYRVRCIPCAKHPTSMTSETPIPKATRNRSPLRRFVASFSRHKFVSSSCVFEWKRSLSTHRNNLS